MIEKIKVAEIVMVVKKLNEVIEAVNQIEGALSDMGNLSKSFVDIAKGLRGR